MYCALLFAYQRTENRDLPIQPWWITAFCIKDCSLGVF